MNAMERRRLQNRDAQRRFRWKKACQDTGKVSLHAARAVKERNELTNGCVATRPLNSSAIKVLRSADEQLFKNSIAQQDARIDATLAAHSRHNQCQSPASSSNSPWSYNDTKNSHLDSGTTGSLFEYDDSNISSCSYHMNKSSVDFLPDANLISVYNDDSHDIIRHMPHYPVDYSYSDSHRTNTEDRIPFPFMANDPGAPEITLDCMNIYEHYDSSTCNYKDVIGGTLFNSIENQSSTIPRPPAHIHRDDDTEDDNNEPFQTSLHIGAERGHVSIVSMLLSAGAPVDALDSEANTALHRAARGEQIGVIRLLLEHGADPNRANAMGWTPVHLGVSAGSTEIVELLVQYGGDLAKKAKTRNY